jgi:4-aminobutyrate aminotransferase/(S)-3-amino-2-methylpropionate transaminase
MTHGSVAQSRHLETSIPGPRSQELHAQRMSQVTSGFGVTMPVFVERASGGILQDVDGNRIIDFASGIAVTSVGASNPHVQEHVASQLDKFTHTCFMVTEYDVFTEVCQWLNENTPGEFAKRSALFSTGAEAIENAIKISRSATGRPNVLVFDDAYHGRSLLTMAMTAKENPYKFSFGPFPTEIYRAPFASPLRGEGGADAATVIALAGVRKLLAEVGPETFAAMVVEPIQGEGGFIVPTPGFLPGLREIATEFGIVLVIDEIQAGMGRTGSLFAISHEGVEPDLIVTAKALAGGLPLSAVTGREELMNAPHVGGLGGTYAGNPLACAAALGVFEALQSGDLISNAHNIEGRTRDVLAPLVDSTAIVAEFRGRGAMLAIELADRETLTPYPELAKEIAAACHKQGVLVLVCGTFGNVIRLLPPLVITNDVLEDGLAVIAEAVSAVNTSFLTHRLSVAV